LRCHPSLETEDVVTWWTCDACEHTTSSEKIRGHVCLGGAPPDPVRLRPATADEVRNVEMMRSLHARFSS
jgi:hypothetical protein